MIGEIITRTKIANVVAAVIVIGGLIYFFITKDAKGMMFLAGAGVGYLFKRTESGAE